LIAICTSKEAVVDPEKLKKRWLSNTIRYAEADDFKFKTSDWIIQEIGLAVGMGIEIVLLIEKGLRPPGGLQGNVEYVEFTRESPREVITPLIQMINSLRPKLKITAGETAEATKRVDEFEDNAIPKETEDLPTPNKDWVLQDYIGSLFQNILRSSDKENEFTKAFESSLLAEDDGNVVSFKAHRLFIYHLLRRRDVAKELRALFDNHPTNLEAGEKLARVYEGQGQFEQALKIYEHLVKKSKNKDDKIAYLTHAARIASNAGLEEQAHSTLFEIEKISDLSDVDRLKVLKARAQVAKKVSNKRLFCYLVEGILGRDPEDNDLRFALAYNYSELGFQALALKHYLILKNKDPNEAILNNIGVAYSHLGFKGKSIGSYELSKGVGGTLAVNNLAVALIGAGFFDQAETLCKEALRKDDCDEQVGGTFKSIQTNRKSEDEKESDTIEKTNKTVSLFNKFTDEASTPQLNDGPIVLSRENQKYEIYIKGRQATCSYSYEVKEPTFAAIIRGSDESKTKIKKVEWTGQVIGRAIVFEEFEEKKASTILGGSDVSHGIIIFSHNMLSAEYTYLPSMKARTDSAISNSPAKT